MAFLLKAPIRMAPKSRLRLSNLCNPERICVRKLKIETKKICVHLCNLWAKKSLLSKKIRLIRLIRCLKKIRFIRLIRCSNLSVLSAWESRFCVGKSLWAFGETMCAWEKWGDYLAINQKSVNFAAEDNTSLQRNNCQTSRWTKIVIHDAAGRMFSDNNWLRPAEGFPIIAKNWLRRAKRLVPIIIIG